MTSPSPNETAEERRRRERPVWLRGLIASIAIHAIILALFPVQSVLVDPASAAGPRAGDDQAAAGSLQAMNIRTPPSTPIIPPPIPLPTVTEVEPVEFEPEPVFEQPSLSGESIGPLEAPGLADGTGQGDGGTSDEGLNLLQPPVPKAMFLPPDSPDLKDSSVEVWVFVDERGRVVPDSTQIPGPTRDRGWNRRVIALSAEWVFDPAVKDGRPVSSWFRYSVEFN